MNKTQHHTTQHHTTPHYTALHTTTHHASHHTTADCTLHHHITPPHTTTPLSTSHHNTPHHTTTQHNTTHTKPNQTKPNQTKASQTKPHHIKPHYTTLHHATTSLHYTTLHYTTLRYTTLNYTTQHNTTHALTTQHTHSPHNTQYNTKCTHHTILQAYSALAHTIDFTGKSVLYMTNRHMSAVIRSTVGQLTAACWSIIARHVSIGHTLLPTSLPDNTCNKFCSTGFSCYWISIERKPSFTTHLTSSALQGSVATGSVSKESPALQNQCCSGSTGR